MTCHPTSHTVSWSTDGHGIEGGGGASRSSPPAFLRAFEDLPFWCALFALLLNCWTAAFAVFFLALAYRAAVRWAVRA